MTSKHIDITALRAELAAEAVAKRAARPVEPEPDLEVQRGLALSAALECWLRLSMTKPGGRAIDHAWVDLLDAASDFFGSDELSEMASNVRWELDFPMHNVDYHCDLAREDRA